MRWIATLLFMGVVIRHRGYNWLAETSYNPAAWFYILGGLWEALFCGVMFALLYAAKETVWRNVALSAMTIGILEGAQISVCRLAITNINAVPKWQSLCDHVTGLHLDLGIWSLYVLILSYGILKRK